MLPCGICKEIASVDDLEINERGAAHPACLRALGA